MDDRRPLVLAFILGLLFFAAVGAWWLFGREPGDAPPPADVVDEAQVPDPQPAEPLSIRPPTFDIVRIDPTGTAVIAGRGEPGADISVLANGAPLLEMTVDRRGEWAGVTDDPLPAGAVELTLLMTLESGQEIRSDQVVIVSVPEVEGEEPLVVLGRPGGPSRILQGPIDVDGAAFALTTVDYDDAGAVIFSGRAEPGSRVRILADGEIIAETMAGEDGRWSVTASATLPPGVYQLQLDQIDENGRVTAVLALPFERAAPEDLANVGPRTVVVQPGNSLWRIARRLYGEGWQYTVIYEANAEQIRDPDLIYPGQIFDIPEDDA